MLSLTRCVGRDAAESGRDTTVLSVPGYPPVRVVVTFAGPGRVRLAFDADPAIRIDRAELLKRDGTAPGR